MKWVADTFYVKKQVGVIDYSPEFRTSIDDSISRLMQAYLSMPKAHRSHDRPQLGPLSPQLGAAKNSYITFVKKKYVVDKEVYHCAEHGKVRSAPDHPPAGAGTLPLHLSY